MNNIFDIKAPIETISEVMTKLNLSSTELKNPKIFDKFKYIAEFVKDIPNKDRFFTRLSKAGQINVNKLDFFYEYCNQRSEYEHALSSRKELEDLYIKSGDEELFEKISQMDSEIREIESNIEVYEN